LDFGLKNAAGESVEHKFHRIACLDIPQAVLTEIGIDPGVASVDESHRRLSHGDEFPFGQLQVGDDAVGRCQHRGAQKVELGLLDRSERLTELRIVGALRSKLLLGALKLGLASRTPASAA
jgi:hypothetical protein